MGSLAIQLDARLTGGRSIDVVAFNSTWSIGDRLREGANLLGGFCQLLHLYSDGCLFLRGERLVP